MFYIKQQALDYWSDRRYHHILSLLFEALNVKGKYTYCALYFEWHKALNLPNLRIVLEVICHAEVNFPLSKVIALPFA